MRQTLRFGFWVALLATLALGSLLWQGTKESSTDKKGSTVVVGTTTVPTNTRLDKMIDKIYLDPGVDKPASTYVPATPVEKKVAKANLQAERTAIEKLRASSKSLAYVITEGILPLSSRDGDSAVIVLKVTDGRTPRLLVINSPPFGQGLIVTYGGRQQKQIAFTCSRETVVNLGLVDENTKSIKITVIDGGSVNAVKLLG